MSTYASFVTEPFWQRDMPEVYAYFVDQGFTASGGFGDSKGHIVFSGVVRDGNDSGCLDQISYILDEVGRLLKDGQDFKICAMTEYGQAEVFSILENAKHANMHAEAAIRRQIDMEERKARADRDRAAAEGMVNPDLDRFLKR